IPGDHWYKENGRQTELSVDRSLVGGRLAVNQNLSKSDKHRPAGEEWVLKESNKAKQQVASYANIVAGKWNTGVTSTAEKQRRNCHLNGEA
ncbi:hypothetical protein Ancab_001946, partial [Ancistrocladus abbreviatus]